MLRDHVKVTAFLDDILRHEAVQAFYTVFNVVSRGTKVLIAASTCGTFGMVASAPDHANDEVTAR